MYVIPRRSLKLTILSCEGLPSISRDRFWAQEAVRNEHQRLTNRLDQAQQQLQQCAAASSSVPSVAPSPSTDDSRLLTINIDPSALGAPPVAQYMQYLTAVGNLQDFRAMYGESAASGRSIAPNCYACVTLERNAGAPPLALTNVKRSNCDPFWNKTIEDINIDLMLLCGEMESATYLYCQRLRIAVYHDFGFGQPASTTGWEPNRTSDSLAIGEAFLAVGELFADPCQKRHELKLYGPDHCVISGCTLYIETKVSCSNAKVPPMFPCQSAFPAMLPVERDCGNGCGAADVSLSADSITLPSAFNVAVQSRGSCKRKCKNKVKCKCKPSHKC